MSHSVREQNGASKSVYRLELNVGLVDNLAWGIHGGAVAPPACILATAGRYLRDYYLPFLYKAHTCLRPGTSILAELVSGTEPTVYLQCDLNAGRALDEVSRAVSGMVEHLAGATGQEAIAWRLTAIQSQSDTQENETVEGLDGPKADAWRPFNPAFFVTRETPVEPGPHWAHV